MAFAKEMLAAQATLEKLGWEVALPQNVEAHATGTFAEEGLATKLAHDAIRVHYQKIVAADAILVVNYDKRGIAHYVGGNSLMELGFGHVLGKKIFLLYPIPDMPYTDEITAVQPIILDGDLTKTLG
jgi:hypothetical protein